MIEQARFFEVWGHLCKRFGRDADPVQGAAYFEYLTEVMDTEAFVVAARALWASARFFPSPAEFLTVQAAAEWPLVQECVKECHPPEWKWSEAWKGLSPRAQQACRNLGGVHTMRITYERDPLKLKTAWESEFAQVATAEVLALPAARAFPSLASPQKRNGGGLSRAQARIPERVR